MRGLKYEKTLSLDERRHPAADPLWRETGSANWLSLPMPTEDRTLSGRKAKESSLFETRGVFVGGEFFFDGYLSFREFTWHQRVVSYSNTRGGIRGQLDRRYLHLLRTGEVYGMSEEEVRQKVRFAVWYLEMPSAIFDPKGPTKVGPDGEKAYTWHQGE